MARRSRPLGVSARRLACRSISKSGPYERLAPAFARFAFEKQTRVGEFALRLPTPQAQVEKAEIRLDGLAGRMRPARLFDERLRAGGVRGGDFARRVAAAITKHLEVAKTRIVASANLLESYSYQQVLHRGFTLIRGPAGEPIVSVTGATPGLDISMVFHDGMAEAVVKGKASAPPKPSRKAGATSPETGQGSLL